MESMISSRQHISHSPGELTARNRLAWMDLGRCIAALAVISIHVSGVFANDPKASAFYFANIVDGFSRFCVPVFFMFSGHLLCGKTTNKPISYTYTKAKRLFQAYLLASAVSYIFDRFYQHLDMQEWPINFVAGQAHFHLRFIPALIGVYFFHPLFMRIKGEDKKYVAIFVALCVLLSNMSSILYALHGVQGNFVILGATGPIYFLMGFFAYDVLNISRRTCLLIFLSTSLTIGCADIALATHVIKIPGAAPGSYTGPLVFLQSAAFFLMIANLQIRESWQQPIKNIAALSFGIYIFHHAFMIFMLDALNHLGGMSQSKIIVLTIPSTYILAGLTTMLVKRIPLLARIL